MQKTILDIIERGGKSEYELIGDKKVLVERGQFWIQKQRQGHSMHYIVPYQACFAPQIPKFFIEKYSKEEDVVLDPFCGRCTTVFEANQLGRIGFGVDVSPLGLEIAKAKKKNVKLTEVINRLKEIDFSKERKEGYEEFKDIYHPKTYSQLLNIRDQLRNTKVDNLIKVIILGRLHGHSDAFFSVWTFNVISLSKDRIKNQAEKRGMKPEFRDIVPRIIKKAKEVMSDPIIEQPKSRLWRADSRNMPFIDANSIDLIITSPPFLNVVNYIDDNWLRFWFLGFDRNKLRKKIVQTDDLNEYTNFIKNSMEEMNRVLKKDKYCIIEVGDIRHQSKKLYMDHIIVPLAGQTGFEVGKVMINYMTAPKISKAFKPRTKNAGTKTNRCVIMRKVS
ncbi:hypothetical protein HYW20_02310 [Candidatus Woesearchaeota archaeon]|nr:hypothetical protein [Candidatus Woesearchaeota archaeon]